MSKNINQVFIANPITSNTSTDLMYFGQSPYGAGNDAAMTYANFALQFGAPYTPAALTEVNDTNVTLTLGGTPATALFHAVSLTLGWTGTLAGTRGGTGVNNGSNTATFAGNLNFANAFTTSGNFAVTQTYTNTTNVTFPTSGTLATTSQVITNVNQTTSSATLAANSRYATNNGASLVTYTIPAGAAVGDTYIVVGGSSGGWTVAQPASVQCHIGSSATTSGTGGSLSSSNQYDCLTITCVASNVFTVYGVQGNITVV